MFEVARIPCKFLLKIFHFNFFYIILLAKCEYHNKTYSINQTFITLDCKQKCVCGIFNRNVSVNCSSLCNIPVNPVCRANSQEVEVYQEPVKGTNCSCPAKRCITGLKLFQNNDLQILTDRVVVSTRFEVYDLSFSFDLSLLLEMSHSRGNMSINCALLQTKMFFL